MQWWIGVVSRSHVLRGVDGGFAQLCHGKANPLRRMGVGDWLVYYSPKTDMSAGAPLQKFTAIGRVVGEAAYQFQMSEDFIPYRRDIGYVPCEEASIHPLIGELSFIKDPKHWGYSFRFGHFKITEQDFLLSANAMKAEVDT